MEVMSKVPHPSDAKMLAVVRCGDESLHETWASNDRDFDFAISYYGNDPNKTFPGVSYVEHRKGGKWDGLYGFFTNFPEVVEQYDFFWFPDDDISARAIDINRMLHTAVVHKLELFQPSLDNDSYYSHIITVSHPTLLLRYTNFVEIMAPVLSRSLLKAALPSISETRSGFGLDFVWPLMIAELGLGSQNKTAIIDSVTVCHTRPVGGNLHKFMRSLAGARSSRDELLVSLGSTNANRPSLIGDVSVPRICAITGLSKSGRTVGRFELFLRTIIALNILSINKKQPIKFIPTLRHAVKTLL
ncbi:hypothetical protein ACLBXB_28280 [Methylobacterium mesophilicum]